MRPNQSSNFWASGREEFRLVSTSMTSSAKRLILCEILPIRPVIRGFERMCSASGSINMLKISGDNGHPW